MRTADFDFVLPPELIAQTPAVRATINRGCSCCAATPAQSRTGISAICSNSLRSGDVLVLNNSRVIPARLRGVNAATGGQFEMLLLEENAVNDWWAMLRPGKRARAGTEIILRDPAENPTGIRAKVIAANEDGHRRLVFTGTGNLRDSLDDLGEIPLASLHQPRQSRRTCRG